MTISNFNPRHYQITQSLIWLRALKPHLYQNSQIAQRIYARGKFWWKESQVMVCICGPQMHPPCVDRKFRTLRLLHTPFGTRGLDTLPLQFYSCLVHPLNCLLLLIISIFVTLVSAIKCTNNLLLSLQCTALRLFN